MPYIKKPDRPRFTALIEDAVKTIHVNNDPQLVKGEYFGFMANRVIKHFARALESDRPSFNSHTFNEIKRNALIRIADKFCSLVFQGDPLAGAGDLNYVISAVLWGIQGSAKDVEEAGYGYRAYLAGMLVQIRDELSTSKFANVAEGKERTMIFRRLIITKRIVDDVLAENYRVNTVTYEDKKIAENGTLWVDGVVNDSLD